MEPAQSHFQGPSLRTALPTLARRSFQRRNVSVTVSNLKKWRFRGDVTADKVLVDEGFDELEDLGDRFQDRFEGLLTKPFTNKSYIVKLWLCHVRYSSLNRTLKRLKLIQIFHVLSSAFRCGEMFRISHKFSSSISYSAGK